MVRGSDEKLKGLAQADLLVPEGSEALLNLADRYKAEADATTGLAKTHLLARAGFWYGQALGGSSGIARTKTEKKLAEIQKGLPPQRPIILSASYGAHKGWADVTEKVRWIVQSRWQKSGLKLGVPDLDLREDPAPGEHKTLVVVYRCHGGVTMTLTGEADKTSIPAPPGPAYPARGPGAGRELVLLQARYGG